ncbi:MAG: hypothetical protein QGH33_16250 [Pirellulaceae bacterium]|jgi:hypothetical protein|nr:hypothetical protein [Pirellulaceae bacterium]MDP7303717.1 hypothetical protein [Pirellulaceae bacterium]HJN11673.1 hypothetical protein [Pirellulaceae bacterium]
MAFAKFLVCEESNRWTVALRWGLAPNHRQLVVAQSLDDCWQNLDLAPASFVVLELNESNLESIVERLQDVRSRFPLTRVAVMCDRPLASCQWLVREAGAVHVAVSTRDMSTIIRLAERHFAQVCRPLVGIRQSVWDRLPWRDA